MDKIMRPEKANRIHHHVRLPDGKDVEVVYLDQHAASAEELVEHGATHFGPQDTATPLAGTSVEVEQLHVCSSCGGELVHPLAWREEFPGRWRLLLRCPSCERLREGLFASAAIERLDDELDRAAAEILSDLKRVTHRNMAEELELFVKALALNLIDASDFQR